MLCVCVCLNAHTGQRIAKTHLIVVVLVGLLEVGQ